MKEKRKADCLTIFYQSKGRPCQRCIKRSIGHLCHDEIKNTGATTNNKSNGTSKSPIKKTTANNESPSSSSSSYLDTSSSSIPVVPQHLVGNIKNIRIRSSVTLKQVMYSYSK